jgi:hypothetical protein
VHKLRFANLNDGWAVGPDLWATHDGGAHWTSVAVTGAGSGGDVMDLEASAGLVHAAVSDLTKGVVRIETSPVDRDAWQVSPTTVPLGAGPVPRAQLVLHDDVGWLVEVDRTVVGGARFEGGHWTPWSPPCAEAGGGVVLAASTAVDLVAGCDEGLWNDRPRAERAHVSTDAGTTFRPIPSPVPVEGFQAIASPVPRTYVVAGATTGAGVLMASFDGGATWATVERRQPETGWSDLGFTSRQQGVVVNLGLDGLGGRLFMTFNGGHSWTVMPIR